MAQLTIGVGTVANDGTGDTDRAAWIKVNTNFTDLYRLTIQAGKTPTINGSVTIAGTDSTTITLPGSTGTVPAVGLAQTWTGIQTFTNSTIKLLGSSTGATTFTSANAGASNYVITIPGATDTVGLLGTIQTWSAVNTYSANIVSTKDTTAVATQGAFSSGTLPYSAAGNFASFNAASTTWTQIIVSNSSNTGSASANIVVSNSGGTETTKYGCLGINSDSFLGTACAGDLPTATYLCNSSGDLAIGTNTANAVHFFANYAVTDAITISSGNVPSIFNGNHMSAAPANGQLFQVQSQTELLTIAVAASSTTTFQIPAGAIVLGVSVYVQTAIPTATTFTVGDSGSATRYSTAAVSVNLGSSDKGTAAGAYYNATAKGVIITPNGTPAANTGRVRVTAHYLTVTAPTS